MRVLITGVNGFVGSYLVKHLPPSMSIVGTARGEATNIQYAKHYAIDFDENTDWSRALADINIVIHCAARAHQMNDTVQNPAAEYHRINALATSNLARQAARLGVERFIFLSSIKVNGRQTQTTPFTSRDSIDINADIDGYGWSKYRAEQALQSIAEQSDMKVVCLRLPLLYGAGAKGNLATLLTALKKNYPLPVAKIDNNRRSMLYIGNLLSLLEHLLAVELMNAYQVFMLSDGDDVSTAQLVSLLKRAVDSRSWLIPVPLMALKLISKVVAKRQLQRLLSNLQVDSSDIQQQLNWQPRYSTQQGLLASFSTDRGHD